MTKNKVYFVKKLCEARGLDQESEEAKELYSLKIVDILLEIKKENSSSPPPSLKKEERGFWSMLENFFFEEEET